jgi:hypothetical protein
MKEAPVTCISCGNAWDPEPILKSKQPIAFDEPEKAANAAPEQADADLSEDLDIDVEDGEPSPDDEVDLGGDDDLGVDTGESKDES